MQCFRQNLKYPVQSYEHEMTDPKLKNMNGRYTETFKSNLQILLIPRHVPHLLLNSINETQKHFSTKELEYTMSPYKHEMIDHKLDRDSSDRITTYPR